MTEKRGRSDQSIGYLILFQETFVFITFMTNLFRLKISYASFNLLAMLFLYNDFPVHF